MRRTWCAGILVAAVGIVSCSKTGSGGTPVVGLNAADSAFIVKASYGNWNEASAGKIADSLASRTAVKMFGAMMVTDHSSAQMSLDSIGNKWGIMLPSMPDSAHKAAGERLMMLSGVAFDSTYLNAQIVDHQAAQLLYEEELKNGQNQQVLDYTNRILPIVKMHLAMADSLAIK